MSAHHDSEHSHDAQHTSTRLAVALFLTLGFVIVEAIAGYQSGSLALLSDAGHNLTDVIALGLSWYALGVSQHPANARKTFGYHRVGILVAFINSMTLIAIALGIFYEAYQRVLTPAAVDAPILIGVGIIALLINALTAWLIMHGSEHDLNLRSAFVHLMGDVLSTLGAIAAGIGIYFTHFYLLDPAISLLIAGLILWNAWGILKESIHILLESTPADVDMSEIVRDVLSVEDVYGIYDLHVWSLNQNLRMLSAHLVVKEMPLSQTFVIHERVNQLLKARYHIHHTTLQLECKPCEAHLLYCNLKSKPVQHKH